MFFHGPKHPTPLEEKRLEPSVSSASIDTVDALVSSVRDAMTDSSNTAPAKAKQPHSLGVLLDGFQEKVANIQEQEHERMKVFEEIRSVF